jgi:hypothetical protein
LVIAVFRKPEASRQKSVWMRMRTDRDLICINRLALVMACFIVSWTEAHPPEFHRNKSTPTNSSIPTVAQKAHSPPSELDRQVAYFQFEFLLDLVRRCPLAIQTQVVQHLIEENRLATKSLQAIGLSELQEKRQMLADALQQRIATFSAIWRSDTLTWNAPSPEVVVAKGLSRYVIVNLRNETDQALQIIADSDSQDPSRPMTVLPGRQQPFLLSVGSGGILTRFTFTSGSDIRSIELPVKIVPAAKLLVKLIDGDAESPTAGRVWVEGSDGQLRRAGSFAANPSFLEKPILELTTPAVAAIPFFYAKDAFEIDVPPGNISVTLERGFEHRLATETVEVKPGEVCAVKLRSQRFYDAAAAGWISGDTHIHWVTNAWNVDLPLADLGLVQRAEDLRVANNLTLLHRTRNDAFIKPSQAPIGPLRDLSDTNYHIEMAEEYRNQNLYGHLCFLNLQWLVLPIGTGPQIAGDDSVDFPLNKSAILEARGQGGISIEAHGVGANHELPLNAIHGLTDSIDQLDPVDYYRLLDCGFQVPLTNGSDHPARIAGCARAYVAMDGPFDYEKWIDGIRRGRTFTTSGPLLFLTVDGQGPGSVINLTDNEPKTVQLKAMSRFPLGRVQILSNGQLIKDVETKECELVIECLVPGDESRWVVARCSRNNHWNALWHADIAHTSAIYIHREGRPVFRELSAREWIERMRMHARDIMTKGMFANVSQRDEAIAYVDESIRRYQRVMQTQVGRYVEQEFAARCDRLLMQSSFASHHGHAPDFVNKLSQAKDDDDLSKVAETITWLRVHINPESRVKVSLVTSPETVVQHRTHRFLVEVHNEARITAPLRLQALDRATDPQLPASWCSIQLLDNLFSSSLLSGEEHEWKLAEFRCVETGHREVHFEADVGQGTQDMGFCAAADMLFKCVPRNDYRAFLKPALP